MPGLPRSILDVFSLANTEQSNELSLVGGASLTDDGVRTEMIQLLPWLVGTILSVFALGALVPMTASYLRGSAGNDSWKLRCSVTTLLLINLAQMLIDVSRSYRITILHPLAGTDAAIRSASAYLDASGDRQEDCISFFLGAVALSGAQYWLARRSNALFFARSSKPSSKRKLITFIIVVSCALGVATAASLKLINSYSRALGTWSWAAVLLLCWLILNMLIDMFICYTLSRELHKATSVVEQQAPLETLNGLLWAALLSGSVLIVMYAVSIGLLVARVGAWTWVLIVLIPKIAFIALVFGLALRREVSGQSGCHIPSPQYSRWIEASARARSSKRFSGQDHLPPSISSIHERSVENGSPALHVHETPLNSPTLRDGSEGHSGKLKRMSVFSKIGSPVLRATSPESLRRAPSFAHTLTDDQTQHFALRRGLAEDDSMRPSPVRATASRGFSNPSRASRTLLARMNSALSERSQQTDRYTRARSRTLPADDFHAQSMWPSALIFRPFTAESRATVQTNGTARSSRLDSLFDASLDLDRGREGDLRLSSRPNTRESAKDLRTLDHDTDDPREYLSANSRIRAAPSANHVLRPGAWADWAHTTNRVRPVTSVTFADSKPSTLHPAPRNSPRQTRSAGGNQTLDLDTGNPLLSALKSLPDRQASPSGAIKVSERLPSLGADNIDSRMATPDDVHPAADVMTGSRQAEAYLRREIGFSETAEGDVEAGHQGATLCGTSQVCQSLSVLKPSGIEHTSPSPDLSVAHTNHAFWSSSSLDPPQFPLLRTVSSTSTFGGHHHEEVQGPIIHTQPSARSAESVSIYSMGSLHAPAPRLQPEQLKRLTPFKMSGIAARV
ncbi:hypothetical protein IE81DRAFT_364448 [Ceraceosorus guamensis]|uniref:Uncharacterized protein n=1 Tax=Ceraceosorus guamensis TaxID=1522189 RepID=A0A316WBX6_9BASI|nr:hypothetical protein IE81DRAFT_364448 [Ceraceosorus guamensis]PWN45075.1 hypothetical protein IE81DRAFT_364448 [Ceraceosorus guamensis]